MRDIETPAPVASEVAPGTESNIQPRKEGDEPCAQSTAHAPANDIPTPDVQFTGDTEQGASNAAPNVPPVGAAPSQPAPVETPEQATGYTTQQCEDRTYHQFTNARIVVVDIYKTGEIVVLGERNGKRVVIECNKSNVPPVAPAPSQPAPVETRRTDSYFAVLDLLEEGYAKTALKESSRFARQLERELLATQSELATVRGERDRQKQRADGNYEGFEQSQSKLDTARAEVARLTGERNYAEMAKYPVENDRIVKLERDLATLRAQLASANERIQGLESALEIKDEALKQVILWDNAETENDRVQMVENCRTAYARATSNEPLTAIPEPGTP